MKKHTIKILVKLASFIFKGVPLLSVISNKNNKAQIKNVELKMKDIKKELKIGIMSDLHLGWTSNEKEIKNVFKKMKDEGVKAIFILGDIVESKIEDLSSLREIIKEANGIKIFCLPGNHEHQTDPGLINIREKLLNRGITLVINETLVLEGKFGTVYVDCLDDPMKGLPDFEKLKHKDKERILLCHSPEILAWGASGGGTLKQMLIDKVVEIKKGGVKEYKYKDKYALDFMNELNVLRAFFGHTHGGQIKHIGKYVLGKESYGRKFFSGKYEISENKEIYVMNGLGNSGIPFRYGVETDAYILTITNDNKENE